MPPLLPRLQTSIPGPQSLRLAQDLRRFESANVTFVDPEGRFPIFWEKAEDCIITDVDNNTFLDLTAAFGVASVGHGNKKVVEALQKQAAHLIHGMGDVHPSVGKVALAQRICELSPGDLGFCIFGANGADAVEAALKTARLYTGKSGVLAFENGYHGLSYGTLAVTARRDFSAPFAGQVGTFARYLPYAAPLDRIERELRDHLDTIGAVILEPIQGRGGIMVPPDGWLSGLRRLCNELDILFIADEIFTGWGRTGDFWACDYESVVPDILCAGKALGGGFPLSVCVSRPHIARRAWHESTGEALHTSTFLGSPLGCAAALAALNEITSRNLRERARNTGAYFKERLQETAHLRPDLIAGVRGRGLMLGLVFHEKSVALELVYDLLQRGIIVLPAGSGEVIEFVPPLIIERPQIDWAAEQLLLALPPAKRG